MTRPTTIPGPVTHTRAQRERAAERGGRQSPRPVWHYSAERARDHTSLPPSAPSAVVQMAQAVAGGHDRVRGIWETWRCEQCRSWTMDGAYLRGACNFCGCDRPADTLP